MTKRAVVSIYLEARRKAFRIVKAKIAPMLPRGWTMHFAVGWGLCLTDERGETVFGTYTNAPGRLPRGVRKASRLAAEFSDLFSYANEEVRGKGPPVKRKTAR